MKISNNKELLKPVEIVNTEDGNTTMNLQGDATITVEHKVTDEVSTVAVLRESGEMDFIARPSVGGVDVALATDGEGSLETQQLTISDNQTYNLVLGPVQKVTTVLYAVSQNGVSETGTVQISQSATGFDIFPIRTASPGYYAQIEFSATDNNGQLMLNVAGTASGPGAGLLHTFEYRTNAVNTLYL